MNCQACLQLFSTKNEPYLLYCGHSLCKSDIERFKRIEEVPIVDCPVCGEIIQFSCYENNYPPKNQRLLDFIKHNDEIATVSPTSALSSTVFVNYEDVSVSAFASPNSSKNEALCQNCSTTISYYFCNNCACDLCLQCDHLIHSNKVFASHRRTTKSHAGSTSVLSEDAPQIEFCTQHPNEVLKFYCMDRGCAAAPFLCAFCVIQPTHRQHSVTPIDNAVELFKKELISKELSESSQLIAQLENLQFTANETKQYNDSLALTNQTNIQRDFALIHRLLNTFEKKLLQHVAKEHHDSEKDIIQVKMLLVNLFQDLFYTDQKLQSFLQTPDAVQFLKMRKEMLGSIQEVTGRVTSFLEQAVLPTIQTVYDAQQFVLSPELQVLIASSKEPEAVKEKELDIKLDRDLTTPVDFVEETLLAANENEVKPLSTLSSSSSVIVGNVAHSILSAIDHIERNIPFYPRLVVTDLVTLEPKEMHLFSSITVKPKGILSIRAWDGANVNTGLLYLVVQGCVLVEPEGEINLVGKGYRGGQASDYLKSGEPYDDELGGMVGTGSPFYGTTGGGGGGYMTPGMAAKPNTYQGQFNYGGYGGKALMVDPNETDYESYMRMGSGGGAGEGFGEIVSGKGGSGGGLLIIKAAELRNFGRITVNGENGEDGNCQNMYMSGGGGGSGGCIKIECNSFFNAGHITAVGGKGGVATISESPMNNCSNGGDGGDGLIILKYEVITESSAINTIQPAPKVIAN